MIKPPPAVNLSRRDTLKKASAAVCASLLPFGFASAQSVTPAAHPRTYRRYNASGSAAGKRMLKSYTKAVRAMLALPPEDPRNWYRHAIIHTMDCPHGNWWFLPWHRAYLGWFEQICRELSNDPHFALPYWDWTTEPKIPDRLFDDVLDPNHHAYIPTASEFDSRLRAAIANAGYWTSPGGTFERRSQFGQLLSRSVRFEQDLMFDILTDPSGRLFYDQPGARGLRRERPEFNAATTDSVSRATILAALDAPDFPTFGSPKSANHATAAGYGILEAKPHNSVHRCVGSLDCNFVDRRGFMTDMLSPVDPIFFLHHANMDRLWDVWERKQHALGLSTLPAGAELRTNLPEAEKSAAEKATDYYRWAREPLLFFVDRRGEPVSKTAAGDYVSMATFGYDYEPGAGEEAVPRGAGRARAKAAGPRVFHGKILSRKVGADAPASAVVAVPAAVLDQAASAGATLVANIALNFSEITHDPYVVVVNGPEHLPAIDASSPFYLATIMMFGHLRHSGQLTYALPLGDKLGGAGAGQRSDGSVRLRVVPLHGAMGHGGTGSGGVELMSVNVQVY